MTPAHKQSQVYTSYLGRERRQSTVILEAFRYSVTLKPSSVLPSPHLVTGSKAPLASLPIGPEGVTAVVSLCRVHVIAEDRVVVLAELRPEVAGDVLGASHGRGVFRCALHGCPVEAMGGDEDVRERGWRWSLVGVLFFFSLFMSARGTGIGRNWVHAVVMDVSSRQRLGLLSSRAVDVMMGRHGKGLGR